MPERHSDAEIDAAIEALSDPQRLEEAQRLVQAKAPQLQRILDQALEAADWYGSAHQAVESLVSVLQPTEFTPALLNRLRQAYAPGTGMADAFRRLRETQTDAFPMTVIYAFKQAEDSEDAVGVVSTGWETMLEGLLQAGMSIHGTWPMRTEGATRMLAMKERRKNQRWSGKSAFMKSGTLIAQT